MKIKFSWEDAPFPSIWEKFVLVAAINIVNTAAGANMGEALISPLLNQQLRTVMNEITVIAEKKGVILDPDLIVDPYLINLHRPLPNKIP